MSPSPNHWTRREFLQRTAAFAGGLMCWGHETTSQGQESQQEGRKPIASINSIYRMRSHAYHIAGRFIHGYDIQGFHHQPAFRIAGMYNDQYPANDLSRGLAEKAGYKVSDTVAGALGGNGKVDVEGVLLIIEHGDYPLNDLGQIMYPRYELFQQVVAAFRQAGHSVPVFVDKHLSYDHRKAAEMVQTARKMGFGLMAGSSLPVTWRKPELEPPLGTPFEEAVVCHSGGVEIYGLHGLESLQVMLERRTGGETGVKRVRMLKGPAVWEAGERGEWSWTLLREALSRSPSCNYGDPRDNVETPYAILVEYLDGTKAAVLNLTEHVSDITFAGRVAGRPAPVSTLFDLPAPPGAKYFDALTFNIEKLFATGKSPYPVERTLLTSTVLDWAMRSLKEQGAWQTSDTLHVKYEPPQSSGYFRGRYTNAG